VKISGKVADPCAVADGLTTPGQARLRSVALEAAGRPAFQARDLRAHDIETAKGGSNAKKR
jgi:hypothetical protein